MPPQAVSPPSPAPSAQAPSGAPGSPGWSPGCHQVWYRVPGQEPGGGGQEHPVPEQPVTGCGSEAKNNLSSLFMFV